MFLKIAVLKVARRLQPKYLKNSYKIPPVYTRNGVCTKQLYNRRCIWCICKMEFFNAVLEYQILAHIFIITCDIPRSSRPEVFSEKGVLKICSKFTGEHLKCNFNEVALELHMLCNLTNHTSAWVFFCKFAAYFQNTFF